MARAETGLTRTPDTLLSSEVAAGGTPATATAGAGPALPSGRRTLGLRATGTGGVRASWLGVASGTFGPAAGAGVCAAGETTVDAVEGDGTAVKGFDGAAASTARVGVARTPAMAAGSGDGGGDAAKGLADMAAGAGTAAADVRGKRGATAGCGRADACDTAPYAAWGSEALGGMAGETDAWGLEVDAGGRTA